MKRLIREFVNNIGVLVQLRSKKFAGVVDYYFIDWIGYDGCYYSLLAIGNETQLFTKEIKAIGNSADGINALTAGLRQFNRKADWVLEKWETEDVKKYDQFLINMFSNIELEDCDCNGYEVITFVVSVRPVAQYIISYSGDARVRTASFVMGERGSIWADSEEHKHFLSRIVKTLDLEKYYDVRLQ